MPNQSFSPTHPHLFFLSSKLVYKLVYIGRGVILKNYFLASA